MKQLHRDEAMRRLSDVPDEKRFYLFSGSSIANLDSLEGALTGMADVVYRHHVDSQHNDFANWVRDVIGDAKLARDLNLSTNAAMATRRVTARIKWLRSRMTNVSFVERS